MKPTENITKHTKHYRNDIHVPWVVEKFMEKVFFPLAILFCLYMVGHVAGYYLNRITECDCSCAAPNGTTNKPEQSMARQ